MIKRRQGAHVHARSYHSQCRELRLLVLTHNIMILVVVEVFYTAVLTPLFALPSLDPLDPLFPWSPLTSLSVKPDDPDAGQLPFVQGPFPIGNNIPPSALIPNLVHILTPVGRNYVPSVEGAIGVKIPGNYVPSVEGTIGVKIRERRIFDRKHILDHLRSGRSINIDE